MGFIVDEVMQIVTLKEEELESPTFSKDADTNKPMLVYKRKDGNYGVIEAE